MLMCGVGERDFRFGFGMRWVVWSEVGSGGEEGKGKVFEGSVNGIGWDAIWWSV